MKPRWRAVLLPILALVCCLLAPAGAEELELFVKNRAFQGDVRVVRGDLFARLDELLGSLGCSWSLEEGRLVIDTTGDREGPGLTEVYSTILVDGRPVRINQSQLGGEVYVAVAELADALGAVYRENSGLGTADLYAPLASSSGPQGDTVTTTGDGKNSPIVLEKLSFALSTEPETGRLQMRGYAIVRNGSDKNTVERLVLRVEVQDAQGKSWGRFAQACASLSPGDRLTYQFPIWADYDKVLDPHPVLQVEHQLWKSKIQY